jgi:hypothetical protein
MLSEWATAPVAGNGNVNGLGVERAHVFVADFHSGRSARQEVLDDDVSRRRELLHEALASGRLQINSNRPGRRVTRQAR